MRDAADSVIGNFILRTRPRLLQWSGSTIELRLIVVIFTRKIKENRLEFRYNHSMENNEIAHFFTEIADLLEIRGENAFKVRTYQRAARTIENLSESLADLSRRGVLESIDGIGKGIADKIREALETGAISYHLELKSSLPEGILSLLAIPGLGPKKAKLIYEHLNIASIPELKAAAQEGKLQDLPGMGKKSEEKILKGIALLEQSSGRYTLGEVQPIAEAILHCLRILKGVVQAEAAGSYRRGKETIGDLDLLVAARQSESVMKAFLETEGIREVLVQGASKTSIVLANGLQIDLRVIPPDSFGAALQYFTGSKDHNVQLRELALGMNFKLNEYGVFEIATDKKIAGKTEEKVYKILGLAWIPPELREGMDEIALSRNRALPRLIERSDIRSALHNHTTWSDGRLALEELVREAKRRGYAFIAVTDHSGSLGVANGLSPDRLKQQIETIRKFNETSENFQVLAGSEVDIRADGTLAFSDELLQQLDFVIAAVHSGFEQPREKMTERICRAVENPQVHLISHPTGRLLNRRPPLNIDMERLFETCARCKTALEINSHYLRLDLNDKHIREAKPYGVGFALETDTHSPDDFDNLEFGLKTARRGRLAPEDILNTYALEDLKKRIQK